MASISLPTGESSELRGAQRPRICHVPDYASSSGDEAIELAALAGLVLDDWQQFVLRHGLGEREDGSWSSPTVGLVCPRQNGKNSILEARELAGLFLLGEQVIIHSAHEQATASEQFRRLCNLIEQVPEFDRRVNRVIKGKGSEAIELKGGQRILFKTRTGGGGRGFSIDCVVFDEAYNLPETAISAIVPALSARPNTQRWYTSSAVDQQKHPYGLALARQRERGMGGKPGIAFFEWSVDGVDPDHVTDEVRNDPRSWAGSNPSFGHRIAEETIRHECDGEMGPREFCVERLGVGDWPDTNPDAGRVIPREAWALIAESNPENRVTSVPMFAVDANPDRSWAAIGVAGQRADELFQFSVVDYRRGTDWVVCRAADLQHEYPDSRFVVDVRSAAGSMLEAFEEADIQVIRANTEDYGNACGQFFDAVVNRQARYPAPQPELDNALAGAQSQPLGDRWKWARRSPTSADISPLVAVTLALWAAQNQPLLRILDVVGMAERVRPVPESVPVPTATTGVKFIPLT